MSESTNHFKYKMKIMHQPEIEDLQFHIHQIKKQNLDLRNESLLLKVKIRKLNDELNKKNKQLDLILDPTKNGNVTKVLSKHGAALIMKLKDENFSLHKKLAEKDLYTKRLQSELQTARLYVNEKSKITSPSLKLLENHELLEKIENLNSGTYFSPRAEVRTNIRRRSRSVNYVKKPKSRSVSPTVKQSTANLEKSYMVLLNNNLQKIKQYGSMQGDKLNCSCQSASSNKVDTPHEEIQQLQSYLLNVLNEVDSLKDTIGHLQKDQTKTMSNESKQPMNIVKNKSTEIQTEKTESLSTDIGSSKYSTSEYTADSEFNESTDGSSYEANPVPKQTKNVNEKKSSLSKSISIQTSRSFCSRTFAAIESKDEICMKNEKIDANEYDIEIEYIN